jgi:hypothetical protein
MDAVSSLPRVTGEIVYLARTPDKPYTYTYDPRRRAENQHRQ